MCVCPCCWLTVKFTSCELHALESSIYIYYIRTVLASGYEKPCYKISNWYKALRARDPKKIEERRKNYLIIVDSKKLEGRKKGFLFHNQKNRGKNNMLREVESHTEFPLQICQIWVLGTPVIDIFVEVRL